MVDLLFDVSEQPLVARDLEREAGLLVDRGYFDGALAPVLTIDSGDRVSIECVSGNPEWMPPKSSGFEILPELADIHRHAQRGRAEGARER